MALAFAGFVATVILKDQGGNTAVKEYELREATTHATALSDLSDIVALLDAITDAVVFGYDLRTVYREDNFAFPTGGVNVENIAEITALIEGGAGKTATIKIPAPNVGIFLGSAGKAYNNVDLSDTALFAYINGTYGDTAGLAYISDGETLQDSNPIQSGKRVHRASRTG